MEYQLNFNMRKKTEEELTKKLLDEAEDYADMALEYYELFQIACDLLDEYVPGDYYWEDVILQNHFEYKKENYS